MIKSNKFYGVDVMLDLDEQPVAVELNGIESGILSLGRETNDYSILNKLFSKMADAADGKKIMYNTYMWYIYPNSFMHYARNNGIPHDWFSLFPPREDRANSDLHRLEEKDIGLVVGVKFDYSCVSHLDQRIIVNDFVHENMAREKAISAFLLQETDLAHNVPETFIPANKDGFGQFLKDCEKYNKFVYKPITGSGGKGIEFINKRKLIKRMRTDRSINNMVQPCVETLPIYSPKTGKKHLACARLAYFNGFVDGYWRLAKDPVSSKKSEDKLLASISAGGHAVAISDRHKEILSDFAEKFVTTLEAKMRENEVKDENDFKELKKRLYFCH